ncbi:MAG TPA: metallophosphoesterase [Actinomycetota bacterium]|nr:metallophosphoesterase [Actinomycetota bacterium]
MLRLVGLLTALVITACTQARTPSRPTANPSPTVVAGPATTAPEPSVAPEPTPRRTIAPDRLTFAVIGDFGTGDDPQLRIASALRARRSGLDALVTTGDNIYPDGHPRRFERAWHGPYGWVEEAGLEVVASLGNHDVQTDGGRPVMQLMGMPARWYERELGPVRFLVLDANRPHDPEQLRHLRAALAAPSAAWTVLVFHQPVHSCGRHGSTPALRAAWEPVIREGGADLVLNGHDHNYQRFAPIDGVPYVVTGGGGAGLYPVGGCPEGTPAPEAAAVTHHYLWVTATPGSLELEAVDASGSVFDSWTRSRERAAA